MSLNDVRIIKGEGGLGRTLPGQDHISGILFYTDTVPSGFSVDATKEVFSIQQAEALGIVGNYSDETQATGTFLVTNAGAAGNTIEIFIQEPVNNVSLGVYTRSAAATTAALVAAGIAAQINLGQYQHGYTATVSSATVTIKARKGLGIFLNSGAPITKVVVGTIAGTITQFSGGVASELAQFHYHVSEYFRINPEGDLWISFATLTGNTFDFTELYNVQDTAKGKIRQFGVYLGNCGAAAASDLLDYANSLQVVCNLLETQHTPASTVFCADISGISDLSTLSTLADLDDKNVSITIGQDGANLGFEIFKASGASIGNVGTILGAISLSAVNEDIGWVSKFNLSDGNEFSVPAFGNGVQVNIVTQDALLNQLNLYRYIFLRYFVGVTGTFVNDNHCAISPNSDYAYINDNRTIDKASRELYANIIPFLNGTIKLNSNGTLTDVTISYVEGLGNTALDPMVRAGEISGRRVSVSATQNVLATSTLVITVSVLPDGVARNITINLGYVTSL